MSPSGANGGWSEYAKLVLAELERHNNLLEGIDGKLDSIKLQAEVTQLEVHALKKNHEDVDMNIKDLKKRVYKMERGDLEAIANNADNISSNASNISNLAQRISLLEQGEIVDAAIKKYRWWIFAGVFTVMTAVVLPTADLVIKFVTG